MKLFNVILAALLCGLAAAVLDLSNDGMIDIDVTTIKPYTKAASKESGISGDDDDEGSGVQGDSSGSGSGEKSLTTVLPTSKETEKSVVVKRTKPVTVKPSTKFTEVSVPKTPKPTAAKMTEKATKTSLPDSTQPTEEPTTAGDDMFGGGIDEEKDEGKEGEIQARTQDKETLRVLTTEVIAAVVVGGICAIILIAFLVYRLRKRDEGSYVLTDSAYKDTNKLRGDPGKEAFV